MATTTNYGWTTPDDTALVKNGASAIRTLGSSIDTTLKAQIDAQIPDSLLTTTGDTIYASGASTPARLGIGTSGQILTVSGGVPTWASPSGGSMTLLSTTTLSGASTTISGISGNYKDLLIQITGVNLNIAARTRFAPNGTTNITDWGGVGYNTATGTVSDAGLDTYMYQYSNSGNLQENRTDNMSNITITNYTSANSNDKLLLINSVFTQPTGNRVFYTMSGAIKTTSAISSLVFSCTSTATYSGGTVLIYGVK